MRPLIGISCCAKMFGAYAMLNHAASDTYVRAVDLLMDGVPVLIPANGAHAAIATLVARLDGFIFTGSRSNVQPALYGGPAHPEGTPEDPARDGVTLPLIRAAVAAGVPMLAVCRGVQEFNVAMGGSLHQRLQDLPGRFDHSTPLVADARVRTGKAHAVSIVPGSWLHRIVGTTDLTVNSLHNEGIDRVAPGLVVEATAPDGTVEAVRAARSPALAIGLQWHPEYDWERNPVSRRLLEAFGEAVRARLLGSSAAAD